MFAHPFAPYLVPHFVKRFELAAIRPVPDINEVEAIDRLKGSGPLARLQFLQFLCELVAENLSNHIT